MRARGFRPHYFARLLAAEQHGGRAINDTAGVARGVDMSYRLHFRIFLNGHVVEAGLVADHRKGGVQPGQALHAGVRPHGLVVVQYHVPHVVADGHDGAVEVALRPGCGCAVLTGNRIGVDVLAAETVQRGDQVGADSLRHEVALVRGLRVDRHRAAVGTHRHARHALDAAADGHIGLSGHDLRGSRIHGFQSGRAKPVDLLPGHGLGVIRHEGSDARNVGALFANRRDATHDDVIDVGGIQVVTVSQRT